jgi:hypothetical protein
MYAKGVIPRLVGDKVFSLLPPDDKAGNVETDSRLRTGAQELDQHPIVASRTCREWIECRQLFKDLLLLLLREAAAPYLVVVTRATCLHHERAFSGQHVFERKMNFIGPTCNFSNRAYRSMHHHSVARPNTQPTKVICQPFS